MFDTSKFPDSTSFYMFHLALLLMIAAEVFIVFYTHSKDRGGEKINKRDKGTKWMLMINFYVCIYLSFFMVGHNGWDYILNTKLPVVVIYPGVGLMLAGIMIRLWAVLTLKRSFTLSVQTSKEQHLITTGIYGKVRNPAYTGSICSLIGTALGLRGVIALAIVIIFSIVSYTARIFVEEEALRKHFGKEFTEYEKRTYRLIPYIW
ncbi:isoprenylcysteine carboxyl methyltransferase [Lacrimispora amygdalina]|uniref:Isoprenylcysteine carboxyl methyltransferase n=1 Tax=Lacrimispora amygdalina TaxID=253257 RepID=A0A3E2N4E3_9FIRM|nr:isoprenylcysteine carboxylmethyltransferase family protein [Clostridium indicum]RFZ75853.1 isoprenylcysteine carboxylmethyltransferase family protein [Clostridium indicum]